jgi:hypothetical protein
MLFEGNSNGSADNIPSKGDFGMHVFCDDFLCVFFQFLRPEFGLSLANVLRREARTEIR